MNFRPITFVIFFSFLNRCDNNLLHPAVYFIFPSGYPDVVQTIDYCVRRHMDVTKREIATSKAVGYAVIVGLIGHLLWIFYRNIDRWLFWVISPQFISPTWNYTLQGGIISQNVCRKLNLRSITNRLTSSRNTVEQCTSTVSNRMPLATNKLYSTTLTSHCQQAT